jgi:hypothetical protein
MFLERCYTSLGLKSNGIFGFILAFLIVITSIWAQFTIFKPKNYKNERVFCASPFTIYDKNVPTSASASVIFDFLISFMDFLLLIFNKWRIKAYR